MIRPPPFLLVAVLLAALALVACGGDEDKGDIGDIQSVAADCGEVEYAGSGSAQKLIVSDLPLRGDSAERSTQMNDAIIQELARKGWQAGPGVQLAFQACDDSLASTGEWDDERCRANARAYASNPDVIGVIGTYNSGCAALEIPILNRAPGGGVPMVSPGNTLVCLTETASTCEPNQPDVFYPTGKRNYARVVPNDAVQGAGMASFASQRGVKRPFVLIAKDDPTAEGQGQTFIGAGRSLGMTIAGVEHYDPDAKSFTSLMDKAKAAGADAIYLGAILEEAGAQLIREKVAVLGPNDGPVKLLAPDGFGQQATIDQAGPASAGMLVSLPGKPPGALTGEGENFVHQIRSQVGPKPVEVFAPYAGEAAEVLINAIRVGQDRAGTIDTLFKTHVSDGITGSFSIAPSGDASPAPISVQRAAETFELAGTITPPPQLIRAARGG